jgi:hypothetical protein
LVAGFAAAAHVLALDRLAPGSPVAGRAYFISQDEPVELWPFINRILALAGNHDLQQFIRQRPLHLQCFG